MYNNSQFFLCAMIVFNLSAQNLFSLTCKSRLTNSELKYTYRVTHLLQIANQASRTSAHRSLFRHCFNGFSTIANIINNDFIIIYLLLFIFINNEILCIGIKTTSLCPDPNFEDLVFYYLHSLILYIPISLSLLMQACRVNNSYNPNISILDIFFQTSAFIF